MSADERNQGYEKNSIKIYSSPDMGADYFLSFILCFRSENISYSEKGTAC